MLEQVEEAPDDLFRRAVAKRKRMLMSTIIGAKDAERHLCSVNMLCDGKFTEPCCSEFLFVDEHNIRLTS